MNKYKIWIIVFVAIYLFWVCATLWPSSLFLISIRNWFGKYNNQHLSFSDAASLASCLSFLFILPLLLVQAWLDNKNAKEQAEYIHNDLIERFDELRRIENTQEGLELFEDWVKSNDTEVLWVSKLSIVPGFWLGGGRWIQEQENLKNYNKNQNIRRFFGPSCDSDRFTNIAKAALEIKNDSDFHQLPWNTQVFLESKNTIDDFKNEYQSLIQILRRIGFEVMPIDDKKISSIMINFALKYNSKEKADYKLFKTMFFDSKRILSGSSLEDEVSNGMELREALVDPEIYRSSNVALACV